MNVNVACRINSLIAEKIKMDKSLCFFKRYFRGCGG